MQTTAEQMAAVLATRQPLNAEAVASWQLYARDQYEIAIAYRALVAFDHAANPQPRHFSNRACVHAALAAECAANARRYMGLIDADQFYA